MSLSLRPNSESYFECLLFEFCFYLADISKSHADFFGFTGRNTVHKFALAPWLTCSVLMMITIPGFSVRYKISAQSSTGGFPISFLFLFHPYV